MEYFSERFAQASIPTRKDFVVGRAIKLSCIEHAFNGRGEELTLSLTLSRLETVHTSVIKPTHLVFIRDQGLRGVWEDNYATFNLAWRIEDNGKWVGEWAAKLKKNSTGYQNWPENAASSIADPDYKIISYSLCEGFFVQFKERSHDYFVMGLSGSRCWRGDPGSKEA